MSRHAAGTRIDGMPARPLVEWYWARRRAMAAGRLPSPTAPLALPAGRPA